MGNISELYIRKFARKLEQYNKPAQLPDYFKGLIGDKKSVTIAEVGAGPINTIGNYWPEVEVNLYASDVLAREYQELWNQNNAVPIVPISYQDFEKFDYPDGMFDIVHCVNALDHTKNPRKALAEIVRVCKPGGYIYLRHSPNQMDRFGGHHQWNIYMNLGDCIFQGKGDAFALGRGFESHMEDDLIVSICKKI